MRKAALVINTEKPLALDAARQIVAWLEDRGFQPLLEQTAAPHMNRPDLASPGGAGWQEAEILLVLGGDGTLIRAAQKVAPLQIPILGINTGHLGFLTELESTEIFDHLERVMAGDYLIEERMLLTARVMRQDQQVLEVTSLNDAVISKGHRARLVGLEVMVGNTQVGRYRADGVIVATPTGSTAYSLSAGGPIVGPTLDVLLVTPICPHTMNSRAMVVAGSEPVIVTVLDSPGEVGLSADGSDPFPLERDDQVHVFRSPYSARLVRRHSYSFYDVLRQKLSNEPH